jgi:hypothetical protein
LLIYFNQVVQVFYAKKNRYIGTFDSREKAAFAHEIVREKLKIDTVQRPLDLEASEAAVREAQVAAFEAVGLQCPIAREKSKLQDPVAWQKSKAVIDALNAASGGKNGKAAALAAEHMRGVTKLSSGKWVSCYTEGGLCCLIVAHIFQQQVNVSYAKKQRYIGTFDSREKAAFAHEIVRGKLKIDTVQGPLDLKAAEAAVRQAQVAAFEAVGLQCPIAREKTKVEDACSGKVNSGDYSPECGGKYDTIAALASEHM